MAIRASMYQNRKQEKRVQVSMSEDEAKSFVAREKTTVTAVLKAISEGLAKGPKAKASE